MTGASDTNTQLVLLDFFKEDCRQCQTMEPVLERLKEKLKTLLQIVPVDADRNLQVAVAYGVRSVPAFILLRNGQEVWRQSGLIASKQLEQVILQFS